jgi:hypothetical protein
MARLQKLARQKLLIRHFHTNFWIINTSYAIYLLNHKLTADFEAFNGLNNVTTSLSCSCGASTLADGLGKAKSGLLLSTTVANDYKSMKANAWRRSRDSKHGQAPSFGKEFPRIVSVSKVGKAGPPRIFNAELFRLLLAIARRA